MNRRPLTVIVTLLALVVAFVASAMVYQQRTRAAADAKAAAESNRLVRLHSPVLGPVSAPVTVVEFLDPACEACRFFYPRVKELMARYPQEVRVVIRYAPFHPNSGEVVKLLEAARRQGKYVPVLEAVLEAQPGWAGGRSNPTVAFQVAQRAGLDMERAMADMQKPDMQALLQQELDDLKALHVKATPTFFVNGRSLPSFGPGHLDALVAEEVANARR